MHARLHSRLAEADAIMVIGFAFRDAYINNIFDNILRLRKDVKVIYFNPISIDKFPRDSVVPDLIKNYSSFHHVVRGIGLEENSLGLAQLEAKRDSQ